MVPPTIVGLEHMLFTPGQRVSESEIVVPQFMRAAIGLHNRTTLHVVALHPTDSKIAELLASPVPYNRWHDIWRLECTFRDRKGIIADLGKLLRDNRLDILSTRATTFDSARSLHLDLHFDATLYDSEIDGNTVRRVDSPFRPLLGLSASIAGKFIDDLWFLTPERAMLSIRRNFVVFRGQLAHERPIQTQVVSGKLDLGDILQVAPLARDARANEAELTLTLHKSEAAFG